MLPDYIIYDELKRERDDHGDSHRPRVEVPKHEPPPEFDQPEEQSEEEEEEERDRGVTIIEI